MQVAALCEAPAARYVRSSLVVDAIGVDARVVDQLRVRGLNVLPFIASQSTRRRDSTCAQGFVNLRSAAWWHLRELLDAAVDARLALPPDDDLSADLVTPRFELPGY